MNDKTELFLITGAAGHLGSTLVSTLSKKGKRVRALVLKGEKNLPPDSEIFFGDVCDSDSLDEFFLAPPEYCLTVIHCAGIVSINSGYNKKVYDVNVNGTKNIISMCEKYKVKKLVYVSSVHAIPEKPLGQRITETDNFSPDNVVGLYAKTKAEATRLVLEAAGRGLDACIVHPSGICGPNDNGRGHITAMVTDYYKKKLVAGVKGGYDFVDVRDVAEGIFSCCEKGRKGECYILSNKYYTVKYVLDTLCELTGNKRIKTILPAWFAMLTAPFAELYYKIVNRPPLYTRYSVYTLNSNSIFSHNKASDELGYTARDIKQTLSDTIIWLKEKGRLT